MQVKLPACNPKAKFGEKFGAVYNPACGIPGEKRVNKSDYCQCSACDELVITASGNLLDWATGCRI
jgi:hypothetical protein